MRIKDNIARIVAILMVTLFMSAFSCLREMLMRQVRGSIVSITA